MSKDTHLIGEHTIRRLAHLESENAELHKAIASWKQEEQAWAEEREAMTAKIEFWHGECEKRAEFLRDVENDTSRQCPDCWTYNDEHNSDCDVPRLMQMPEEPKP